MYMTVQDLVDYAVEHNCMDAEIAIEGYNEYGSATTFHPDIAALRSKYTKGYLKIYVDSEWQAKEEE